MALVLVVDDEPQVVTALTGSRERVGQPFGAELRFTPIGTRVGCRWVAPTGAGDRADG